MQLLVTNLRCCFSCCFCWDGADFFQKLFLVFEIIPVPFYVFLFRFNRHIRIF